MNWVELAKWITTGFALSLTIFQIISFCRYWTLSSLLWIYPRATCVCWVCLADVWQPKRYQFIKTIFLLKLKRKSTDWSKADSSWTRRKKNNMNITTKTNKRTKVKFYMKFIFINYAWKTETLKSLYKAGLQNARSFARVFFLFFWCAKKPPAERMENNILE